MHDSVLLVEDDRQLLDLLVQEAAALGYPATPASTFAGGRALGASQAFGAAILDVRLGPDSGLDLGRDLKARQPDIEIIVISADASLSCAMAAYDLGAFAFVPKPFDPGQVFATLERALERRRIAIENRRLIWELQVVNEIAETVSSSLDLDTVLQHTLQRIGEAFRTERAAIHLRDERTGRVEAVVSIGFDGAAPEGVREPDEEGWIPERVLRTGEPVILGDLRPDAGPSGPPGGSLRSIVSLPITAGQALVGALTLCSPMPGRFTAADKRLLTTIAGHLGVAVSNAWLYTHVRRAKAEWERTFDAISDPIAVFGADGRLTRANVALASQAGWPVTHVRGRACDDIGFCEGAGRECSVRRAAEIGSASAARVDRPDGRIFAVTTLPIEGGGEHVSVVQIAKDITEEIQSARRLQQMRDELADANTGLRAALDRLRATQAQLVQSEKLSAIGQLVAGVAHELNNPLTSIIGYAQLIEEELGEGPDAGLSGGVMAQDVRRIGEESERAARIVRNLLAFARRQTGERTPQQIEELIHGVLSLRTYELRLNTVEVETAFEASLPRVLGDPNQVQQVVLNLVLNAEKAMRGNAGARQLRVGAAFDADAEAVVLSVADNGHGIDAATMSRVFDPFFTTRPQGEGTGLGLSICYGIVRDHGGEIWVESEAGAGAAFFVRLPAMRGDVADGTAGAVMVAHPDPSMRDFLAAALTAWGYRIAVATSGRDALQRLPAGAIDVALVEHGLCSGDLPGWTAACTAGRIHLPIVLLRAGGADPAIEAFVRDQGGAAVAPPFQLAAVRRALRTVTKECV